MKILCPHCQSNGRITIVADEMPGVGVRIRVRGGHGYDVPSFLRCECGYCGNPFTFDEGRKAGQERADRDRIKT